MLSRDIHHMTLSIAELKSNLTSLVSTHATKEEIRSFVDVQIKLHDDIERRFVRQEGINSSVESRLVKMSTELKIWLTVAAFIIGAVQATILFLVNKFV